MRIEENNNNDSKLRISAYSMQGRRVHMEDYFDIGYMMKPAEKLQPNEWPYEYIYFGVFDGHGGAQAASFAKKNLLKMIVHSSKFWSDDDDTVLEAITEGFEKCHAAMYKDMPSWTRTNRVLPSTAGTTASILFIRNGKFYTGHVGDSRIVISQEHPETQNWRHDELTQDHKPENEIERIENAGGQVRAKIGVHRVVWKRPVLCKELEEKLIAGPEDPSYDSCLRTVNKYPIDETFVDSYQTIPFLAIARSLGDFWSWNPDSEEYVVSPEPDVMCRPITESDKCILLATDGLWNVMSSSQATRFLQELKIVKEGRRNDKEHSDSYFATDNFYDVSRHEDKANHALSLVFMAYQIWERRKLRSDNITAVVAMLSDILTPQQISQTAKGNSHLPYSVAEIENGAIQFGDTRIFCEDISMMDEPLFHENSLCDDNPECELLNGLVDYLVFPPNIIDTKSELACVLTPPQNYFRLSNAKCRKLQRDDLDDEFIYVKEASDDPADSVKLPTRTNSKNVEIRDSSAQASQAMHDFGQPWDQLPADHVDRERRYHPSINVRSFKHDDEDDDDEEDDMAMLQELLKLAVESRESATGFHKPELNSFTPKVSNDDTAEQVLSVVSENKTPTIRRSTRKSATENSKRKIEIEMSESPKTKRRKSHPIHTIAAVTSG